MCGAAACERDRGERAAGPCGTAASGAAAALQDGGEGAARRRPYRTAARERRGGGPAGRRRARLARLARHRAPFASGRPALPNAVCTLTPPCCLAGRSGRTPPAPPACAPLCPPASHHGRLLRPLACRRLRPPQPRSPELGRRGGASCSPVVWRKGRGGRVADGGGR